MNNLAHLLDGYDLYFIAFRVRRSRGEIYTGHGHLCVCLCLSVPRRM